MGDGPSAVLGGGGASMGSEVTEQMAVPGAGGATLGDLTETVEAAIRGSDAHAYQAGLARGELLGQKCLRCAKLTFPPSGSCDDCGSSAVEWARLSGRGTLLFATRAPACHPHLEGIGDYVYGHIHLYEGVVVQAIVTGAPVTPKVLRALFEHGTIPVVASLMKTGDLPVLAFAEVH
jgi:uncharacterized OB-fold protein